MVTIIEVPRPNLAEALRPIMGASADELAQFLLARLWRPLPSVPFENLGEIHLSQFLKIGTACYLADDGTEWLYCSMRGHLVEKFGHQPRVRYYHVMPA